MHKQELVHLHALCDAVRVSLETRRDVPPDAFRAYDEYGVAPSAIHRTKRAHAEALQHLLDGLTAVVDVEADADGDGSSAVRDDAHPPFGSEERVCE